MNMNGMVFGGEGPMMQGTWYNPSTGDAFTVRDSFFEDNQYTVTTTDGRYMNYNQLQNYIQTDMKLEDLKKMKAEKKQENTVPAEVASLLEDNTNDIYSNMMTDDDLMIGRNAPQIGNLYSNPVNSYVNLDLASQYPSKNQGKGQSMNEAIIEKALKNASKPEFTVSVNWSDYPEKQIEMLKDIMDIPVSEIIDWYLDNIDMLEVVAEFKLKIAEKLGGEKKSELILENTIQETPEVKPKTPAKKTTKKSTKNI